MKREIIFTRVTKGLYRMLKLNTNPRHVNFGEYSFQKLVNRNGMLKRLGVKVA